MTIWNVNTLHLTCGCRTSSGTATVGKMKSGAYCRAVVGVHIKAAKFFIIA